MQLVHSVVSDQEDPSKDRQSLHSVSPEQMQQVHSVFSKQEPKELQLLHSAFSEQEVSSKELQL
jgi:hypothetical protein